MATAICFHVARNFSPPVANGKGFYCLNGPQNAKVLSRNNRELHGESKKQDTKLLPNIGRFSKFFHY